MSLSPVLPGPVNKRERWRCAECGRVMTTKQAQRAMAHGCLAGCSGIDIEPMEEGEKDERD